MELRQSVRGDLTRPIVLVMAFLSVLALALTSWYVLTSSGPPQVTLTRPALTNGGLPGPDARERNQQFVRSMEPTHGH